MTTEEKRKSVEDQVVLITRGNISKLHCPYCGETREASEPCCCPALQNVLEKVAEEQRRVEIGAAKISIIEERIREAESRTPVESDRFGCPYCGVETRIADGEKYCCKLFYMAVQAVAGRREMERDTARVAKIMEAVYKERSLPLVTLN